MRKIRHLFAAAVLMTEQALAGRSSSPGPTPLSNATPWHAFFTGNFASLSALVTDFVDLTGDVQYELGSVVRGGGRGGAIVCGQPGAPACPPTGGVPSRRPGLC